MMAATLLCLLSLVSIWSATPASSLKLRLKQLQRRGIMIGHQDDPMYGHNWSWEEGRSDVKEVCGDNPAVMGFDLGEIELGHAKNLDGVPFDRIRQEVIRQHNRGGIVTLSWHLHNLATGKNAWDASGKAVSDIVAGGSLRDTLDTWLGRVAKFMSTLRDSHGKFIPIIFRPWHEMSGDWFW